jgi:hypothetical protein
MKNLYLLISCLISLSTFSQYNIIADKDNTHPEFDKATAQTAYITNFAIRPGNNSNEIIWNGIQEQETRKYIIEYSNNGRDFLTAGEMLVSPGKPYTLHHYYNTETPLVYRVRTEQLNGKYFYSSPLPVIVSGVSPVEVYPTIITGNVINANAAIPVEKVIILSGNGDQVYLRAFDGKSDYISFAIPQLSRGMYYAVFYGRGWKSTEKIIIQ